MLGSFYLPPELWLYIHRLAVPNMEPTLDVAPDDALSKSDMKECLQAACALSRVCRSWNQMAHEVLYENVWVNERFASLTAALERPSTARLVRRIRLSTNHCHHNAAILRQCPKVEVVVQPEFPRSECLNVEVDVRLPALPFLRHLYWIQSCRSSELLQSVLHAAPNLTHICLSTSWRMGTDAQWSPTIPALPHLSSLMLARLSPPCVRGFLRTDLTRLTRLAIDPMHFRCADFPVLPALHTLVLVAPTSLPFPAIFSRCPNVRELRYDVRSRIELPDPDIASGSGGGGSMPCLECLRLDLPDAPQGAKYHDPALVEGHFRFFLEPAFAALHRVVLEGNWWVGSARRSHNDAIFRLLRDELLARGGELEC